jgi:hypothetical protein
MTLTDMRVLTGQRHRHADNEEWMLESLLHVAAGFYARVAECPKRTWAILTKYDTDRAFLAWVAPHGVHVPPFGRVQAYVLLAAGADFNRTSPQANLTSGVWSFYLVKPQRLERGR